MRVYGLVKAATPRCLADKRAVPVEVLRHTLRGPDAASGFSASTCGSSRWQRCHDGTPPADDRASTSCCSGGTRCPAQKPWRTQTHDLKRLSQNWSRVGSVALPRRMRPRELARRQASIERHRRNRLQGRGSWLNIHASIWTWTDDLNRTLGLELS